MSNSSDPHGVMKFLRNASAYLRDQKIAKQEDLDAIQKRIDENRTALFDSSETEDLKMSEHAAMHELERIEVDRSWVDFRIASRM